MRDDKQIKYQKAMLYMLNEVHEYCGDNQIEYFIIAGTLLGATRHKGFIPWDIDIDIAMTRENYDRFISEFNSKLDKRFTAISHLNTKKYYSPHAKIIMNDSKIIYTNKSQQSKDKTIDCIYLDLFPLDYVPHDFREKMKQKRKIKMLRKIISLKKCIIHRNGFLHSRFFVKKAIQFILLPFRLEYLNIKLSNLMIKNRNTDYTKVCSKASKYSYEKQLMSIDFYRPAQIVNFENLSVYAPNKISEYLVKIYGESYMEIPTKKQQYIQLDKIDDVLYPKWLKV